MIPRETKATPETCFLHEGTSPSLPCQRGRCFFWEAPGCALERVGLRSHAESRPELTTWLLGLRSELSAKQLEFPEEPLPPHRLLPRPAFRS